MPTAMPADALQVLDHGFVRLIQSMGDDASIVQAARISYGPGTKTKSQDERLINYLMKNEHTSPFEMVEFKFHAKMPIFVARQWVRHRTASINEISARYSILPNEYYLPADWRMQSQSTDNKQGSGESLDLAIVYDTKNDIVRTSHFAYELYEKLLRQGLSRELARMVLPTNFYTEWYWKANLHNVFHFLKLRLDKHAQYEIRVYAEAVAYYVEQVCPTAYSAFQTHILKITDL